MPNWLRTLLVPVAILALVAAACGDDGDGTGAVTVTPPSATQT